jgi:hypothetical protein
MRRRRGKSERENVGSRGAQRRVSFLDLSLMQSGRGLPFSLLLQMLFCYNISKILSLASGLFEMVLS